MKLARILVTITFASVFMTACGGDDSAIEQAVSATATAPPPTLAVPATTVVAATVTTAPSTGATNSAVEARISKAYNDSRTFVPRASIDELKVSYLNGVATVNVVPSASSMGPNSKFLGGLSNDALAIATQSAIVASKVTFDDVADAKRVVVHVVHAFSLTAGGTRTEIAATVAIDRATAAKFNYEELKSSVPKDPRPFVCGADAYRLHVVVWNGLADKACLASPSKGAL